MSIYSQDSAYYDIKNLFKLSGIDAIFFNISNDKKYNKFENNFMLFQTSLCTVECYNMTKANLPPRRSKSC